MSDDFYKDLSVFESFEHASNSVGHFDVPEDWYVVVSDVTGSTRAIENGHYKNVNTVGALAIIGIINVDRNIQIPYIFGGDGATLAIPKSMIEGAKSSLLAVKYLARKEFDLDMRVGIVPVPDILEAASICRIAKYRASGKMEHAVFSGRGWELAEKLLKSPDLVHKYQVSEDGSIVADGDFSGLQCRWNNISSVKDHKVCILIQAMHSDPSLQFTVYQKVFAKILEIYGEPQDHHPLRQEKLKLSMNPIRLYQEAKINGGDSFFKRCRYTAESWLRNVAGIIIFKFKIDTEDVKWSQYVADMIDNSDYKKFDGSLRMVLDGDSRQFGELSEFLTTFHKNKDLCFGLHTSNEALMTCLIFSYNGDHTHFVDGADGGYAMAAKQLKKQIAEF
ncbi:DUF3095 domain-containing protein [Oligoflexaceae bacterium]|nr:DUF3095 domain-containing protein [Oligoflexaceae bacterium]